MVAAWRTRCRTPAAWQVISVTVESANPMALRVYPVATVRTILRRGTLGLFQDRLQEVPCESFMIYALIANAGGQHPARFCIPGDMILMARDPPSIPAQIIDVSGRHYRIRKCGRPQRPRHHIPTSEIPLSPLPPGRSRRALRRARRSAPSRTANSRSRSAGTASSVPPRPGA